MFMDFSDLEAGSAWREELITAAGNSAIVVAVLSRSYTERFWCMYELNLARRTCDKLGRLPYIIPVFYDGVDEVVQPNVVMQRWGPGGDLYQRLERDRRRIVLAAAWADNISAMTGEVQAIRRRLLGQSPDKDEDRQLALKVVRACMRHLPPKAVVGHVVGFEEQLLKLVSQIGGLCVGRLGVWIYGQGGGSMRVRVNGLMYLQIAGGNERRPLSELVVAF